MRTSATENNDPEEEDNSPVDIHQDEFGAEPSTAESGDAFFDADEIEQAGDNSNNQDNSDQRTASTDFEEDDDEDEEDLDSKDKPGEGILLDDDDDDEGEVKSENFQDEVPLLPGSEDEAAAGTDGNVAGKETGDETTEEKADKPGFFDDDPILKPLLIFMIVAVVLSIIIFPILYLVVLPNVEDDKNSNNNNKTEGQGGNGQTDAPITTPPTTTLAPIELNWVLPLELAAGIRNDPDSSTAKAYDWVSKDPQLNSYSDDRKNQRMALAGLYYSTTDGDSSDLGSSWLSYDTSECTWEGTTCAAVPVSVTNGSVDANTTMEISATNESSSNIFDRSFYLRRNLQQEVTAETWNQVVSVSLPNKTLQGPIPAEFALLTGLTLLDLSENQLTGPIPTLMFQNLVALTTLKLRSNRLEGELSPLIGNWEDMFTLDLSRNGELGKQLPSELGKLLKIETLDLSFNQFTGQIPDELSNLDDSRKIYLQNNKFQGTLPLDFGLLDSIRELDVSNNQITGPLPPRIGALTLLAQLHLNDNMISSTIPSTMSFMRELEGLLLQSNKLSGTVPSSLEELRTKFKLTTMDLSDNPDLEGEMPELLCNVTKLLFTCLEDPTMPNLCGCDCPCFNGTVLMENSTSSINNGTDLEMEIVNATIPPTDVISNVTGGNTTLDTMLDANATTAPPDAAVGKNATAPV